PELSSRDLFAGITHRFVADDSSVFTIQIGVLTRSAEVVPRGDGPSFLSANGWTGNWFSTMNRTSTRYSASATWDRAAILRGRSHNFSLSGEVAARKMTGRI